MDRARLVAPVVLALVAVAMTLPHVNAHGFWFDEAYTARLAALDGLRLLAGAQQDIHPPGWPLIAGAFSRLPIPMEWALRLPSVLAFAALVWLVSTRNALAGAALLVYDPLVEQATQGRPYVLLALGVTGFVRLLEQQRWFAASIVLGLAGSLHALAGPLLLVAGAWTVPWRTMSRRDWAALTLPAFALTVWWIPEFAASATRYVRSPWYGDTTLADLWIVSDAGGAVVAVLLVTIGVVADRSTHRLLPAAGVVGLLLALEAAGVGVEVRKTGLVLLPLILAALGPTRAARLVAIPSFLALALRTVELPARPDLREARDAIAVLTPLPTISVFASEAAWYLRQPAPLPSYREPEAISARILAVLAAQDVDCLVTVSLPGTFPETLPVGVETRLIAPVTGLDVRVVGNEGCVLQQVQTY